MLKHFKNFIFAEHSKDKGLKSPYSRFNLANSITNSIHFINKIFADFLIFAQSSREKLKDIPKANYELGTRHFYRGDISDAIMRFKIVCFLRPEYLDARSKLARCYYLIGSHEACQKQCEKIISLNSKHVVAQYLLQKMKDSSKIKSVPVEFTKDNLDLIARSYEGDFFDLSYNGHKALISLILENFQTSNPKLCVLDLGCGIGLCGENLIKRGAASSITGVDGSEIMLEELKNRTEGKKIYNRIVKGEVGRFLASKKETAKYDLIIFDYCFPFLGELKEHAKAAKDKLSNDGYIALAFPENFIKEGFNFEEDYDYFEYSLDYIKSIFEAVGLKQKSFKRFELSPDDAEIFLVYTS